MASAVKIISDSDLGTYVVCSEAWRLKHKTNHSIHYNSPTATKSVEKRREWVKQQTVFSKLKEHAKVALVMLLFLVIALLAWELKFGGAGRKAVESNRFYEILGTTDSFILILILCAGLVVWDVIDKAINSISASTGVSKKSKLVSVKGSGTGSLKDPELGIISQPDAIIDEEGVRVPVDRYPTSNKIQDRHVIKMVCHLAILRATEKEAASYGILIMGEQARSVKINFTEKREIWLRECLADMRKILGGAEATASPAKYKCKHCDVRESCDYRID